MPVWVSLFIALVLAGFVFFALFGTISALVEGRRFKARPQMGVSPGDVKGSVNVWVTWDPSQFNVQIYRLCFRIASPLSVNKENTFTVTFESPMESPFVQPVQLPADVKSLIETAKEKFILTVDFKTVQELTMIKTFTSKAIKEIYLGKGSQPSIANKLAPASADKAVVLTLDYQELQARKKKIKDLEAQAKAKAKPAAPKPAPAATATAAAAPAPAAAPAAATPAAKPAPAAPAPVSAPQDVPATKSVRDVVAAKNAAKTPEPEKA